MSEPGSSWANPIWHRNWRIYAADQDAKYYGGFEYEFAHDNHDGAPDGNDSRSGYATTLDDAKSQIDMIEEGE